MFLGVPITADKYENKPFLGPLAPQPFTGPIQNKANEVAYARPNQPLKVKARLAGGFCSCVSAINNFYKTDFKTVDGYARSIPVNSKTPAETGFVITYESWMGHIAHYYRFGDDLVIDYEANYQHCALSSGRILPIASPLIKGYIN